MKVDETALKLSCSLAFMRMRAAGGRPDILEAAAKELGIDDECSLALSIWLLFGRTCPGDIDEADIRATILFSNRILSGAAIALSCDAI